MSQALSNNQLLLGLGLVLTLAVGSQLLAKVVGLPAIVVLLPAGFIAGIATDDVRPSELLGALFQPFVSVAVGVILFEAGLRLSFRDVTPRLRSVIARLVSVGLLVTWIAVAGTVALFFGLGRGVDFLIAAILVVSGPTVVLPLLSYIRPTRDVRSVLKWEGVLVDPLGAILGVGVFQIVVAGGANGWHPGKLIVNVVVGAAIGAIGAGLLWLLLRRVQRFAPRQVVAVTLALVVAALVSADVIRDDSGFVATLLMGVYLANQRSIDVATTVEFQDTLVQLLIGVLFVLIAASVTPHEVSAVIGGALALVAVMVFVIRPAVVALSTWRSSLSLRERAFVAWMAPRGIVAGATASAFGLQLAATGTQNAEKILPIVFVVIFATVLIYGLTGKLVAQRLAVAGEVGTVVLIVGGHDPARKIGRALQNAGVGVRLWAGPSTQAAARAVGLEADSGKILIDSLSREAELEEVTDAVLMSTSDDFNALAAADLRSDLGHGHVYRIAPAPDQPDLLPPVAPTDILGDGALTLAELSRRLGSGQRIAGVVAGGRGANHDSHARTVLFVVDRDGAVHPPSAERRRKPRAGDVEIELAGTAVEAGGPAD